MKKSQIENGAASVIVVFILVVLIATMLVVAQMNSKSALSSAILESYVDQATYLAESALERTVYNLNNDPDCSNLLNPDQQTFGNGTFEIDSITVITVDTECDIKVKAEVNGIVRYIDTVVFNVGGSGGGGGTDFFEQFIYANTAAMTVNWAEIFTGQSEGNSSWNSANCPAGSCPGSAGGSFFVQTTGTGGTRNMTGYRERSLTPVNTGTSGLNITLTGAWFKASSSGATPRRQRIYIELRDSIGGVTTILWSELNRYGNSGVQLINVNFALPANRTYDSVRMRFDLRGRRSGRRTPYAHPQVYLDEISITGIGGGGMAPDWRVVEWKEVGS